MYPLLVIRYRLLTYFSCERSNSWLSESPYAINTSLVPRGGHRRRKSMEPRTIQNINGILFEVPPVSTSRSLGGGHLMSTSESRNPLDTLKNIESRAAVTQSLKINRRKSTQWVRSPEPISKSNGELDFSSPRLLLSPVPTTPAPETISAYAKHVLDGEAGETPYFLCAGELVQRTAPPKQQVVANGFGSLGLETSGNGSLVDSRNGIEGGMFMQRLLQARRKSLQWAPKVGSPLGKGVTSLED